MFTSQLNVTFVPTKVRHHHQAHWLLAEMFLQQRLVEMMVKH